MGKFTKIHKKIKKISKNLFKFHKKCDIIKPTNTPHPLFAGTAEQIKEGFIDHNFFDFMLLSRLFAAKTTLSRNYDIIKLYQPGAERRELYEDYRKWKTTDRTPIS